MTVNSGAPGVLIPYTCGELFQGTLDGLPCLVSCPITKYSSARVVASGGSTALPNKARRALDKLTSGQPLAVDLQQSLPPGRGYGTSTADIGSVLFAAAGFLGVDLEPVTATRLAASIEPTDSSLLPGLALLDHLNARVVELLGPPLPITIVVLDPGGEVDSEIYNQVNWKPALQRLRNVHRLAFEMLHQAIITRDVVAFGAAATQSAAAHQNLLPNPFFKHALSLSADTHAVGVCRAHSGTILGLMYASADFDEDSIFKYLQKRLFPQLSFWKTELTGGGPIIKKDKSYGS